MLWRSRRRSARAAENQPASEQNAAIDINDVSPNDIEALPPDESSETSSNELVNGADNADVSDLNGSANAY